MTADAGSDGGHDAPGGVRRDRADAPPVYGLTVDDQTRCIHYGTSLDVVAIEFHCCRRLYPCHLCHDEVADHDASRWPRHMWREPAILCGVCRSRITIARYLATDVCPSCEAPFNPGCRLHSHLYFETL